MIHRGEYCDGTNDDDDMRVTQEETDPCKKIRCERVVGRGLQRARACGWGGMSPPGSNKDGSSCCAAATAQGKADRETQEAPDGVRAYVCSVRAAVARHWKHSSLTVSMSFCTSGPKF